MADNKYKILLRRGKENELNRELIAVGEPCFAEDTGNLFIKKADGNLVELRDKNDFAVNIKFDEISQKLSLVNDDGENIGDPLTIKAGIDGLSVKVEHDEDTNVYTMKFYDDNGTLIASTPLPATGGGGGSSTTSTITVDRITSSPLILTTTDNAIIEIDFSSTDSEGETFDGTYTWKSGNNVLLTGILVQGRNTFDLSEFVSIGTQKFTLTVVDEAGSTVVKSWTIQKVDVRLESTFTDRYTTPIGRNVSFTYTPYGAVNKVIHFKIDGVEDTVTTSASGTLQSYTIPAKAHGSHLLEVWATATINSTQVETNHIFRDIIWYDENSNDAVIGCIYRNDYYGNVTARQYDTTPIIYNVYDPTTNIPTVKRYVDDKLISTDKITSSQNVWNFKSDEIGTHTLVIEVRNTRVTIIVNVTELGIDVSPITANLEIDFNPTGINNSSSNREWSNDNYKMTVSDNFDWANGGYKIDENGDSYFLVKAGTRATFNYEMFAGGINGNPSVLGSEMKIVFMTENVQDANAVWFSNVDTTTSEVNGVSQTTSVGIQMSVHEGWLKTNSASSSDVTNSDNTETVAATNTYLYMPYSEEDIIEMDINIDKIDKDDTTAKAFVMAYEDGVPSKAFVYDNNDRFYQYNAKPIVIGSDECDVRIYRMKIYSSSLTTEEVMKNFIADSRDTTTMLNRYDRNSIYYNRETNKYTPYCSGGVLDPEKLAPVIPNVKVLMLETDHFTTSKKVFVKSKLRCIQATGGKIYSGDPYYDNWYFENGYHSGQGTTSDNYGNAGRNVDFLFNCDGKHKPSDKVKAEEGYISKVTLGYGTENARTESVTDWKGDEGKIALTRTSVPNNFFNLKVNIASSENVNNALLQKRYNDFLPYISPAKKRDSKIKNDMEFVPAILFLKETNPDTSTHNEFLDTEWHFYALGNIGDSKKTDYTRAYDPDDMNEFTIEISDNTKNNAVFQTGIEKNSAGEYRMETFKLVKTLDKDGNLVVTPVADNPVINHIRNIPSSMISEYWDKKGTITVENKTGDSQYDGNETGYLNMRRWCLENEAFDGDHSFEPRYACCGDYRDGKLVNDISGHDKSQITQNEKVWRAFYNWVVTSSDEQFVNELDEWCVRSAVEFFYAFTHYYTMMDNRAKNTFWHFAKTGTYRKVSRPVPELLSIYSELVGDDYVTTSDKEINSSKTYYTQYAFDLWDYDNDTAIGINNNGELIFPYGKEDIDYNIDGNPASDYVFNGATSTFWCRLRDLLSSEITSTFTSAVAECFSANNLIQQFDEYQECYPEEIWRLDIQRKYIRTFTGESIDNSKPKHDVQYLRDMMQGRKKYQRRQWMRDQEMYFGTKNLMDTVVGDNNRITFRCYTPTDYKKEFAPNYTVEIVPYSDIYLSVMFGNGDTKQVRAKAGKPYSIDCSLSAMKDTQVTIYGANRIQEFSDLSLCYLIENNFSMATKLKKLVIGNSGEGYDNPRLRSLTLSDNKLLEELDIRNCSNLTGSLNLAQCSNLKKLYAEGTKLKGVTFATNGKVETAHLPNTVNTLIMRNLNNLTDFEATLNRLETLTLQGGTLNSLDVIKECIDTLQVLYLYDINWTGTNSLSDSTLLNRLNKIYFSLITGTVYVSGQIRNQELQNYANKWSDLLVTYNPENLVTQYLVTYVNADDKSTVLFTTYVDRGSIPPDPYAEKLIPIPTLKSDAEYNYSFGEMSDGEYVTNSGWDGINEVTLSNRTITAKYTKTKRQYTVTWYSREGLSLGQKVVDYGSDVTYEGNTPVNTAEEGSYIYNVFAGWDKNTGFIKEDTDVYAIWSRAELPQVGKDLKDMTTGEIFAVASSGRADSYFEQKDYCDITLGHDFDFKNVESKVLATDMKLDGSHAVDTGIKLFSAESPSFTLAVDYRFINTSTVNNTLIACFEEDGAEGFRLRMNSNPDIQWGDKTINVGYKGYRDMVVIRHKAGEDKLYVYSPNGSSNGFAETISRVELVRNRSTVSENTLTLGAIRFVADGGFDDYGTGYIYWAKVWLDDLGETNCRKLAAWSHETLRAEYCGTGRYRLSDGTSHRSNASFVANALLTDRLAPMNSTNSNIGGWDACKMRSFLNSRLLDALPTVWRSMIKQVKVNATIGNNSSTIATSNDYFYIPSATEMGGSNSAPYISEGNVISWFNSNSSRAKFKGMIIPDNATYYTSGSDPSLVVSNNVKVGDVWNKNNSTIYIYVTDKEIEYYGLPKTLSASIDGYYWVTCESWWERSANVGNNYYFWYVGTGGNSDPSGFAGRAMGVCPCFSI